MIVAPLLVLKSLHLKLLALMNSWTRCIYILTYLELYRQDIWQALDACIASCLLRGSTVVTSIFALIRFDILFIKTVSKGEIGNFLSSFLVPLLRQAIKSNTEIQKGLYSVARGVAILAGRGCLHFAIKRLMNDAVAAMLTSYLGLLAIAIALMQVFGEELEELVCILFLCRDEVFEGFLF